MKLSIFVIIIFHFSFNTINGQITPSQFGFLHPPPPDGLVPERASISAYQIKQDYPGAVDGFYWISNNNECSNPHKLGRCTGPKSFNTKDYMGEGGNCMKSKWAKNCNLTWQGITNNPNICKLTAK